MSSRGLSTHNDTEPRMRFQMELEFVQCLANPKYLNYLAQRGTFREPAFINYLKYLLYWKEPEYAKFLKYPQCLYILDLLQYESFRTELTDVRCCKFIEDQQLLHWKHYQFIRTKLENEHLEQIESMRQTPLQSQNQPSAVALNQPPQQSAINQNLFLK